MTFDWVFGRLVRCQIRHRGQVKSTWRRDTKRGGKCACRPRPCQPMSPFPRAIGVGSLCSLNLCGDPGGMRLGTAHFLVALQHWVTLGWCTQWRQGKRVNFMVQWGVVLDEAQPVYDPAVQHQYEGPGLGTGATPTAVASWAPPVSAAPSPPSPPQTSWGIMWRRRQRPCYFEHGWALSKCRASPVISRCACLLAC